MSKSENQDWSAFLQGDHAAFERIYRAHGPALLRYGKQFSEADAVQDHTQALFVRLWEKRHRLPAQVSIRPYLLTSLRNALLRGNSRAAKLVEIGDTNTGSLQTPPADEAIIEAEVAMDQSANLSEALALLSPRERELVSLRFDHNLDYESITQITGINYQVARNTLSRALKKLRLHLGTLLFWLSLVTNASLMYYSIVSC